MNAAADTLLVRQIFATNGESSSDSSSSKSFDALCRPGSMLPTRGKSAKLVSGDRPTLECLQEHSDPDDKIPSKERHLPAERVNRKGIWHEYSWRHHFPATGSAISRGTCVRLQSW